MFFKSFLAVVVTALVAARATPVPPTPLSGAADSCTNFSLDDSTVAANCGNAAGTGTVFTAIELSSCVANINGVPICRVNGGAAETCSFSNLQATATTLTIQTKCGDGSGGTVTETAFNLNACLSNTNGILTC